MGQEVEVLIDDALVLSTALTVDDALDETGIEKYLEWWISQSWPKTPEHYSVTHFRPETDSTFLWVNGVRKNLIEAIRESLNQRGARFYQCAPISSVLISLDYPKNSIWSFIETRSYQLSGCVGSLPFGASISFYSDAIRTSAVIGEAKLVEPLLTGPSFRTPFQFIEPIPEGRSEVWQNIPTEVHSLVSEIDSFGESHSWKRDLRKNLGVLSVVISSDSTQRILNFIDSGDRTEAVPVDLDAHIKRLEERAKHSEKDQTETASVIPENVPEKKKSHAGWWFLALIVVIGAVYYTGSLDRYIDPIMQKYLKPKSNTAMQVPKIETRHNTDEALTRLRGRSLGMLDYCYGQIESDPTAGFSVTDGKLDIDSDKSDSNPIAMKNNVDIDINHRTTFSTVVDSLHHWSNGQVKTLSTISTKSGIYSPLIVKVDDLKHIRQFGNKLLGLGDNVIIRKISLDTTVSKPSVLFYIAVYL